MKQELFHPGMVFESDHMYVADETLYTIDIRDTQPMGRLISEKEVPVAFALRGLENVTLDFGGARLLFQGQILPFVLENCRNVTIKNLTVDYRRAPYTQGVILEADTRHIKMRICDGFPCHYRDNRVFPVDGSAETDLGKGHMLLQPYDAVTRAPAYNAGCILATVGDKTDSKNPPLPIHYIRSEVPEEGVVVWYSDFPESYRAGQILAFTHADRSTPGIYCCDCSGLVFENIRMKRVAGFAIHAYFCRDMTVRGLVLRVDDDSNELVSINADGVHTICQSGSLLIEDCVLENMLDDGGNFHGYFTPVEAVEGNTLVTTFRFPGAESLLWHRLYRPGESIEVYRDHTIARRGTLKIVDVQYREDAGEAVLTFEGDPSIVKPGDHIENHEAMPEITICRCRTGRNRPRGFLISTWRKALIENCHFYNCSSAIDFTGDTTYWFESGPVNDVTIRGNVFENCGYCGANAPITAGPQFAAAEDAPVYHRNITVEDNLFITFNDIAMIADYCDGITLRNNRYIHSLTYPRRVRGPRVVASHSTNIHCADAGPEDDSRA